MAKIISMKGTGTFTKGVIQAVKGVAKKVVKRVLRKAKITSQRKKKRSNNPSGRSQVHIAAPKGIGKRMRKQGGY